MKVKSKFIPTYEIKNIIDSHSEDKMADWGEWFVNMCTQYYLETKECSAKVLLFNIFTEDVIVQRVFEELSPHLRDFEYSLKLAGAIVDFESSNSGIFLEVMDG